MKNIYGEIGIETEVMEATPHRLVQMMYEKCIDGIQISRQLMHERDVPRKCQSITKVIDIINYLKHCLNLEDESCKDMSENLLALYTYIEEQLIMANMKNEVKYLDNALIHLKKIKDSWDKIGSKV